MTSRFKARKRNILAQLEAPEDRYHDLSPKGSIDEPIRTLINDINCLEGLVTTSSCSGRISVFLEGRRTNANVADSHEEISPAGPGGKGGGGTWLFISHDPVKMPEEENSPDFMSKFGLLVSHGKEESPDTFLRYIHLKFEPMILHILTECLEDSQRLLTAALSAGFRESGAVSLSPSKTGELNPIVAVRSTGYSFDAIIGYQNDRGESIGLVNETCLRALVNIANERFKINNERIARFQSSLLEQYTSQTAFEPGSVRSVWEDAEARKARKREEGLARQRVLRESNGVSNANTDLTYADEGDINGIFD